MHRIRRANQSYFGGRSHVMPRPTQGLNHPGSDNVVVQIELHG